MAGKSSTDDGIVGLERKRAEKAFEYASIGKQMKYKSDEYKAYAKKIPMLIKTNGLGATLAFIKAKSKDDESESGYAYKLIYEQVDAWLNSKENSYLLAKADPKQTDLTARIISLHSDDYRFVTNEVIALFVWLKRFAEGLIKERDKAVADSDNVV